MLEKSELDEQKMFHCICCGNAKNSLTVEECALVAILTITSKYRDLLQSPLVGCFSNYGIWIA